MRVRAGCHSWVLALLFLCAPAAADDDSLATADRAYDAKEFDKALPLYDAVLKDDPDNRKALFRSAEMMYWGTGVAAGEPKKYDQALVRFDRLLMLDPGDRWAGLGKARVLSAIKKHDEAAAVLEGVIARYGRERDTLLNLADARLAARKWKQAREIYKELLARDGNDVAALLGTARSYHYSYAGGIARSWYARALQTEPTSREAELGIAWVSVGADPAGTGLKASELGARFPGDGRPAQIQTVARRARSYSVAPAFFQVEDSADNRIDGSQLAIEFPVSGRLDVDFNATRYKMESPRLGGGTDEAEVNAFELAAAISVRPGHQLALRGRLDDNTSHFRTGDETDQTFGGGGAYTIGMGQRVSVRVSADREHFRYTASSLADQARLDRFVGRFSARLVGQLTADAEVSRWNVESKGDTTNRDGVSAALHYRLLNFDIGYGLDYANFGEDLRIAGLFAPQDFVSHRLEIRAYGRVRNRIGFFLSIQGGLQSWTQGTDRFKVKVTDDQYLGGSFGARVRITRSLVLELAADRREAGLQNVSGFATDSFGARLRWSARDPW